MVQFQLFEKRIEDIHKEVEWACDKKYYYLAYFVTTIYCRCKYVLALIVVNIILAGLWRPLWLFN